MHGLLRPDGILVCEDGDLTSAGSQPPSALDAFADLWGRLGPARSLDYTLGRGLFQLVLNANFSRPEITFNQPVEARGESKRFLEWSEPGTHCFCRAASAPRQEGTHPQVDVVALRNTQRLYGGQAPPHAGASDCVHGTEQPQVKFWSMLQTVPSGQLPPQDPRPKGAAQLPMQ
jgi:hypothetical protein